MRLRKNEYTIECVGKEASQDESCVWGWESNHADQNRWLLSCGKKGPGKKERYRCKIQKYTWAFWPKDLSDLLEHLLKSSKNTDNLKSKYKLITDSRKNQVS